jgi:YVTN family beta-propeller protein
VAGDVDTKILALGDGIRRANWPTTFGRHVRAAGGVDRQARPGTRRGRGTGTKDPTRTLGAEPISGNRRKVMNATRTTLTAMVSAAVLLTGGAAYATATATAAPSAKGATAYVTNSSSGTVTPIRTATNTAGTPITVGIGTREIAITP